MPNSTTHFGEFRVPVRSTDALQAHICELRIICRTCLQTDSALRNRYVNSPWAMRKYTRTTFSWWPNPFERGFQQCSNVEWAHCVISCEFFAERFVPLHSYQFVIIDGWVLTWLNAALAAAAWKFFATNPSGVTGKYGAFAVGVL